MHYKFKADRDLYNKMDILTKRYYKNSYSKGMLVSGVFNTLREDVFKTDHIKVFISNPLKVLKISEDHDDEETRELIKRSFGENIRETASINCIYHKMDVFTAFVDIVMKKPVRSREIINAFSVRLPNHAIRVFDDLYLFYTEDGDSKNSPHELMLSNSQRSIMDESDLRKSNFYKYKFTEEKYDELLEKNGESVNDFKKLKDEWTDEIPDELSMRLQEEDFIDMELYAEARNHNRERLIREIIDYYYYRNLKSDCFYIYVDDIETIAFNEEKPEKRKKKITAEFARHAFADCEAFSVEEDGAYYIKLNSEKEIMLKDILKRINALPLIEFKDGKPLIIFAHDDKEFKMPDFTDLEGEYFESIFLKDETWKYLEMREYFDEGYNYMAEIENR